jgi:hypothetical protein
MPMQVKERSNKICGIYQKTLENTEGAIKNGQSRETGNIGYTRRRKTKQKMTPLYANKQKL